MSMELDPGARFEVVLSRHFLSGVEGGGEASERGRPTFVFRHPMRRDTRRLTAVLRRLEALTLDTPGAEAEAVMVELEGVVGSLLVGWRGMVDEAGEPLAFSLEDFDRVTDESDLGELATRLRNEPALTMLEKKTSALGSASRTASSAGDATGGDGADTKPTRDESPSSSCVPAAGGAESGGQGGAGGPGCAGVAGVGDGSRSGAARSST